MSAALKPPTSLPKTLSIILATSPYWPVLRRRPISSESFPRETNPSSRPLRFLPRLFSLVQVSQSGKPCASHEARRANAAEQLAQLRYTQETQSRLQAEQSQQDAEQERQHAESQQRIAERMEASASENLDLALSALDDIYLTAVGEERLLAAASVDKANPSHLADIHRGFSEKERGLLQRGLLFYQRLAGSNRESESALRRTAQANYRVALLHSGLGQIEQARPAFRAAIRSFESLTSNDSPDVSDWSELAKSRAGLAATLDGLHKERKSLLEAAEQDCTKAIQVNPQDASRYVERGQIRILLDSAAAASDFETAVQLEPDNATHHEILASYYGNSAPTLHRDYEKAIQHATRAMELAPDNAWPYIHLSMALHNTRRTKELSRILELFNLALEIDPNSVFASANRARALIGARWQT